MNYRTVLLAAVLLLCFCSCKPKYAVSGPQGGISTKITLPKGFNPDTDSCEMVILMHGIFSQKAFAPIPGIADRLAEEGIGSIALDFGGHGRSEGTKQAMTIAKELAEARAVWEYVKALPYVTEVSLLGHSQGGVVASMLAGELAKEGWAPRRLVLLAPGAVIKEATQGGHFFGKKFDPANPPEYIRCFGFYKLGREYMTSSQTLDIYGTAAQYEGPVCILHGTKDGIVPLWCSERYQEAYNDSEMHLIEGERHTMVRKLKKTMDIVCRFFREK